MDTSLPLVSITFITHNRREDVRASLQEIQKTTYQNYEIIVVDNDSMDGVAEMIEKDFPQVRLFKLRFNKPLHARNISFQEARGEYIVTLDDDSHPEPEAISLMVKRFQKDPLLGIIAFHIPCGDYSSTRYWNENDVHMRGLYIGCGAGIRKEVFKQIGYYDEKLGGYAEEYDFTYRAYAAGYTVGHFKNIVAHHRPKQNPNRVYRFFCQNERNQNYLIGKFISPRYWPTLYFRPTVYRLIRAYCLGGAKAFWWAIAGNIWGLEYILNGYSCRILTPHFIEFFILKTKLHRDPLWKFFFIKQDRHKILTRLKSKATDHSLCPYKLDNEEEIAKKFSNPYVPLVSKQIFANEIRLSFVFLRKHEEKQNLLKFIQSDMKGIRHEWKDELTQNEKYMQRAEHIEKILSRELNLLSPH